MRFARPSFVMQPFHVLLLTLTVPVVSDSTAFQPLDRVEGWLIERRLNDTRIGSAVRLCQDLTPGSWHGFIWILTM